MGQGERRVPPQTAPLKHGGFRPYQPALLWSPPQLKEAFTGNAPIGVNPLQAVTNIFPQAGGNLVTHAPEVVFDLTQGDKGIWKPLFQITP